MCSLGCTSSSQSVNSSAFHSAQGAECKANRSLLLWILRLLKADRKQNRPQLLLWLKPKHEKPSHDQPEQRSDKVPLSSVCLFVSRFSSDFSSC